MSMSKFVLVVFALSAVVASVYYSGSLISTKQSTPRSLAVQMVERSMR